MQITTSTVHTRHRAQPQHDSKACEGAAVTLSGSNELGKAAWYGGTSLLPGVGAYHNFIGLIGSGFNDGPANVRISGVGLAANIAGTAVTATGLLTGRHNLTKIGAGLLGVSGLTAAWVYGTSA